MKDCKKQILQSFKDNNCCSLSFLNTLFFTNAQVNKNNNNILLNTENEIIEKVFKIINNFFPDFEQSCWDNFLLLKGNIYTFISNINLEDNLNLNYYPNECDRLTILKTLFLTNGNYYYNTDNTKNSTGYSLEFVLRSEELANITLTILEEFGFLFKKTKRHSNFVVYSKNSNIISDLLIKLGATSVALEMQNNLAMREIRNTANRQNNCFEFNLDKTINASSEQLVAINYIIDNFSIDYFDENLKEVAFCRIANPDVSLNELRTLLNNKLSRAGIKYRLDKIIDMYKKLKGEN